MKPRRVKGLDPQGEFAAGARLMARVRLGEVHDLAVPALEPAAKRAQHDLRIAAKRLRYVLELSEPALGPAAGRAAKGAKRLQQVLGEVHDCDLLLPDVRRHAKHLRSADAGALRASAAPGAADLPAAAARTAPNRMRHRGLAAVEAHLRARREILFERFEREWRALERGALGEQLLSALSEPRPAQPDPAGAARR